MVPELLCFPLTQTSAACGTGATRSSVICVAATSSSVLFCHDSQLRVDAPLTRGLGSAQARVRLASAKHPGWHWLAISACRFGSSSASESRTVPSCSLRHEREARERHDAALNEHKTKAREAEDKYAADVHTETGANRPSTGSAPVSRCSSW